MFHHKMGKVQTMKRIYWPILYNEILLLLCLTCYVYVQDVSNYQFKDTLFS